MENVPEYLMFALYEGYDVEVDIWWVKGDFWLGHNGPDYELKPEWFALRPERVWYHCKNAKALIKLQQMGVPCFGHREDSYVMTSNGYVWMHPQAMLVDGAIICLPEQSKYKKDLSRMAGICSDHIAGYKEHYETV